MTFEIGTRVVIFRADNKSDQQYVGLRGTIEAPPGISHGYNGTAAPAEDDDGWVKLDDDNDWIQTALQDPVPGYFYAFSTEIRLLNSLEVLAECAE